MPHNITYFSSERNLMLTILWHQGSFWIVLSSFALFRSQWTVQKWDVLQLLSHFGWYINNHVQAHVMWIMWSMWTFLYGQHYACFDSTYYVQKQCNIFTYLSPPLFILSGPPLPTSRSVCVSLCVGASIYLRGYAHIKCIEVYWGLALQLV